MENPFKKPSTIFKCLAAAFCLLGAVAFTVPQQGYFDHENQNTTNRYTGSRGIDFTIVTLGQGGGAIVAISMFIGISGCDRCFIGFLIFSLVYGVLNLTSGVFIILEAGKKYVGSWIVLVTCLAAGVCFLADFILMILCK